MRSRRALGAGAAVAALYVAGSFLTAHSRATSDPMLDGNLPPQPYRWVSPPSNLAAGNQPPASGHFSVKLTKSGSTAAAFSTQDGQATLILSQGSIPPSNGQTSAAIAVSPLAPSKVGGPPSGLAIDGNVYRVTGTYVPGGASVGKLQPGGDQRVILVYPATASTTGAQKHTVIGSVDGNTWQRLTTKDSSVQQQAQGSMTALGYFAVASPSASSGVPPSAVAVIVLAVILIVLGGLVIVRNIGRDGAEP